ncbi:MAG: hypothetical protein ACTSPW_16045, partial [Promethearchaeota archaeon]
NISGLFFYVVLLIYYVYQIIKSIKNPNILKKIIMDIFIIIILSISILFPYFIHMSIKWGDDLFHLINYYIKMINSKNYGYIIINNNSLNENNASSFFDAILNKINGYIYSEITIGPFTIFTIIAFLLKTENKNKYYKDFIILIKISFFIFICITIIPYIFNLNFILENRFYQMFGYRAIETYFYSILFLATIGWNWFILKLKELWEFIKEKSKKINQFIKNRDNRINFTIIAIILTIIIPFLYTYNRERFYVRYLCKDYYIESVLFIIDNISNDSVLAIPDFNTDNDSTTYNLYSRLLYDYKYYYYNFSKFENYLELYNFCLINKIDFILLELTSWNENITKNVQKNTDFELIYVPLERDWVYRVYKFKK